MSKGINLTVATALIITASCNAVWAGGSLKDSDNQPQLGLSGIYVGVVGSNAKGKSISTEAGSIVSLFGIGPSEFDTSSKGTLGGLQVGYDFRFQALVLGIRGDLSFGSVSGQISDPIVPTGYVLSEASLAGSLVGRLGFNISSLMIYGVSGLSWAKTEVTSTPLDTTEKSTMTGFLLGGGLELAIIKNVSLMVEYNTISYGSHTWFSSVECGGVVGGCSNTSDSKSQVFKLGLNYKF